MPKSKVTADVAREVRVLRSVSRRSIRMYHTDVRIAENTPAEGEEEERGERGVICDSRCDGVCAA